MGMVVQHNISAQNANEAMRKNVAGLKKQTEKLSTGYNINRAADNAAGLAISEKMRSQIRGLTQASANSNDAISLIQTAEGGLQETEDILQRMRELSVQSANGTYTDEDRQQIQYEVDALKSEVDRISQATEYNEMKLLDGSLAGAGTNSGEYGAKYGVVCNGLTKDETDALIADKANNGLTTLATAAKTLADTNADGGTLIKEYLGTDENSSVGDYENAIAKLSPDQLDYLQSLDKQATQTVDVSTYKAEVEKVADSSAGFDGAVLTSNVQGASIQVKTGATKGGEGAAWEQDGKTLTLNLVEGKTYTQKDIDKLIANADTKKADGVVAEIGLKLKDGVYTAKMNESTSKSVAGVRAESNKISLLGLTDAEKLDLETKQTAVNTAVGAKTAAPTTKFTGISDADKKAAAYKELGLESTATADDVNAALKSATAEAIKKATTAGGLADSDTSALVTAATERDAITAGKAMALSSATTGYGDEIKFTSNSYGIDTRKFTIATDAKAGKEEVEAVVEDTTGAKDGSFTLHLATGVEYSNEDIEKLMAKAGLDYDVQITDSAAPDGDVKMKLDLHTEGAKGGAMDMDAANTVKGAGVGKDDVEASGKGLTFQIGANGVEDQRLTVNVDDMSSKALGVSDVSVAKQDDANDAINKIDDAIKAVSTQRAKLGAVQNRLEHTVNSLNTANENLSASESQIRDTDMAAEMIKYTKSNILQQASQSMLAQANQQPQGVLQLLG